MAKPPVGSKANPSEFDVIGKLAEDEPYFVIRAHDPLSSALVELHAYIGAGQSGAAHNKLAEIMAMTSARAPRPASSPKYVKPSRSRWRWNNGATITRNEPDARHDGGRTRPA
tara:strand:- start:7071 stop:7409 length:339 start_codon:yes stop_codon:yes gene_type:complete